MLPLPALISQMAAITFATLSSASQSSLLFLLHSPSSLSSRRPASARRSLSPAVPIRSSRWRGRFLAAVADPEAVFRPLATDPIPAGVEIKVEEDIGGGGGGWGGGDGNSGGGGGGGGDREEDSEGGDQEKEKKTSGMSMSQKLTLGYAALVGVGGVMGYIKSGSQKSAAAGGIAALVLYFVYTQLPVRPAFASSLGLGISAALLGVMGSRFKKSGKVFPAGVVSIVSFVMLGGYFHGILRSLHA